MADTILSDSVSKDDSGHTNLALQSIQLSNLLSFGPDTPPLPLRPLNILIGANGSGKSNLIDAISLLRSCAGDIQSTLRRGGGVLEWVWKGNPQGVASIEAVVGNPAYTQDIRHKIEFSAQQQIVQIVDESIENAKPYEGNSDTYFYYRYQKGHPVTNVALDEGGRRLRHEEKIVGNQSILTQRTDTTTYPEIAHISNQYNAFRIYREWAFGRNSPLRLPQAADLITTELNEDFSNLGLFLNYLREMPATKRQIINALSEIYDGADDFGISVYGNTVQLYLTEGDFKIPATRLSDGTLRYLCLLAILLDPTPPPLICIEEPELGIHPDIINKLADLLKEASTRTQLIVTTHSRQLVDNFTESPEDIVVCEKRSGQTTLERLDAKEMSIWLDKYSLGDLWSSGEIGGNRW